MEEEQQNDTVLVVGDDEKGKKLLDTLADAQKVMNEADVPEDFGALESPIESEETSNLADETHVMKPAQVRLIDYPPGFKSQLVQGKAFQVNGEVFEIYNVMEPKKGRPRFMIRGIGILGILEDPQLQQTHSTDTERGGSMRIKEYEHGCDKCGKNMEDKPNMPLLGFHLFAMTFENRDPAFLKKQFGQYDPKKDYFLCVECYLEALGIVP